jgi:protein SCO1/2
MLRLATRRAMLGGRVPVAAASRLPRPARQAARGVPLRLLGTEPGETRQRAQPQQPLQEDGGGGGGGEGGGESEEEKARAEWAKLEAQYAVKEGEPPLPLSVRLVGLALTLGVGALFARDWWKSGDPRSMVTSMTQEGKPDLGGDWEGLVDSRGQRRSSKDFYGKYVVMYFGFTHCPDICPLEMKKLNAVVEAMEKRFGPQFQPLFVTVDPERDTPEQLEAYRRELHPKAVCLTGALQDIRRVAALFRVYFNVPANRGEEYQVDHSFYTYVIDPRGELLGFYGKNHTAVEAIDLVADLVAKRQRQGRAA